MAVTLHADTKAGHARIFGTSPVFVPLASAAGTPAIRRGFLRDDNQAVVTLDEALAVDPVFKHGFLREGLLGPLIVSLTSDAMRHGFARKAANQALSVTSLT